MKILLAACGKMKDASNEAGLMREYIKRMKWKFSLKEIESKKPDSDSRMRDEAEALLTACAPCDRLIALDERGKHISSRELAAQLATWQQQGASAIGIVIGGADGLHESVRHKADLTIAFGRATWPHMMVRAMLAEQLYRASAILENHPYHRD